MNSRLQQLNQAQKKRIERVTNSGGGAKGSVYAGSYKAMVDTGLYKGVKEFSGASAGALTATLMALGMPPAIFRNQLLSTNLKDLMGTGVGGILKKKREGVSFITKDGKPLEQFIRENIVTTVRESLKSLGTLENTIEQHPDFRELVTRINGDTPCITFADLAVLNRLFPEHFKQLVITAVKFPNGEVQVFNSKLTPNVEIALACRASASIPVVLEPVEIEINGIKQKFVDGGLYDNLPTDYFDTDEHGAFIKNQKAMQTLVFAFGEGLDNKKNQVFQALYGQQWDAVVNEETLKTILMTAMELSKNLIDPGEGLNSPKEEANLLSYAVKLVLEQQVHDNVMSLEESKAIMVAMNKSINTLLLKPQDNQEFWSTYKQEENLENRVKLLVVFVKEKMKPILYNAGVLEKLKRNILIEVFGDLKTPYKNTEQKEVGYQKLRSEYTLRTVELRVGNIKTTDFDEATKLSRVLDALGYLDTINHITNHDLHNPEDFNPGQFYMALVDKFEHIHHATLLGAGKEPAKDQLTQAIGKLKNQLEKEGKSPEIVSRQVYQLIKDKAEHQLDGIEAFALSRAVEFQNKILTADELFKETYEEGFKRSNFFSISNITRSQIFRASTLHDSLKDKSMFELYKNQPPHHQPTRTDKVFDALTKMEHFNEDINAPSEEAQLTSVQMIP